MNWYKDFSEIALFHCIICETLFQGGTGVTQPRASIVINWK
jgi:hypothetical protein